MTVRPETQAVRMARMEEHLKVAGARIGALESDLSRAGDEIAGLRKELAALNLAMQPLIASHAQLQELIAAAQEQRGMGKLARQIFGGSLIASGYRLTAGLLAAEAEALGIGLEALAEQVLAKRKDERSFEVERRQRKVSATTKGNRHGI